MPSLAADHRGAFADPAQRLTQVARAADERHRELVLVDMVRLVGGREHFGLVDAVYAQRLQDIRLDEVPDAALGHDRDGDGVLDREDQLGIAHAGDAALGTDISGDAFERHDGGGASLFGDARLLGVDHIHDHAALEHLGEVALHP